MEARSPPLFIASMKPQPTVALPDGPEPISLGAPISVSRQTRPVPAPASATCHVNVNTNSAHGGGSTPSRRGRSIGSKPETALGNNAVEEVPSASRETPSSSCGAAGAGVPPAPAVSVGPGVLSSSPPHAIARMITRTAREVAARRFNLAVALRTRAAGPRASAARRPL